MRCKECREKIPDNVKYCPECGALINDIKYTINNTTKYAPPVNQNTYTSPYEEEKPVKKNIFQHMPKNKNNFSVSVIITIVIFVLVFAFNALEEINFNQDFFENNNTVYPENDMIISEAYLYTQCFTDAADGNPYEDFTYHCAVCWDYIFSNEFAENDDEFFTQGNILAEEKFNNFIAETKLSATRDYTSCVVMLNNVSSVDYDTFENALSEFSKRFSAIDTDYLSSLYSYDNAFIITGTVDFIDYETRSTKSEDIYMVMINNEGHYELVYDNIFMEAFLDYIITEETSTI